MSERIEQIREEVEYAKKRLEYQYAPGANLIFKGIPYLLSVISTQESLLDTERQKHESLNVEQANEIADLKARMEKAKVQIIDDCKRAIVDACGPCGGQGGIEIPTPDGMDHGCGGDEKLCARMCPIPVQMPPQFQQCEYCGRPCDALEKLKLQSLGGGK